MNNTNMPSHPFAQITEAQEQLVNGGTLKGDFKKITMKVPEDGISDKNLEGGIITTAVGEDGTGPIYTTQAVGEEGGEVPPSF